MRNSGLAFLILTTLAALTLACGSSSQRTLESVSLSPQQAIFNGSPVQFTATGSYNTSPISVSPLAVAWGACEGTSATTEVTVSTSGLAACTSGASGTFTVWGYGSNAMGATCNAITACGGGCGRVTGTATLTCQ
jgi:hypothetical protein